MATIKVMLAANGYADIMIWSLLLMGVIVIGLVVAVRVKRRITAVDIEPAGAGGFTLSDLRAMHRSGQMSDEEYEVARGKMVAAAQRSVSDTKTLRGAGTLRPETGTTPQLAADIDSDARTMTPAESPPSTAGAASGMTSESTDAGNILPVAGKPTGPSLPASDNSGEAEPL